MKSAWQTLAAVLAISTAAAAQDGGKLPWRGKNEDPKAAMADAKRAGQPMMIFFTSVG
jgi:hypothetical protein